MFINCCKHALRFQPKFTSPLCLAVVADPKPSAAPGQLRPPRVTLTHLRANAKSLDSWGSCVAKTHPRREPQLQRNCVLVFHSLCQAKAGGVANPALPPSRRPALPFRAACGGCDSHTPHTALKLMSTSSFRVVHTFRKNPARWTRMTQRPNRLQLAPPIL